jgi:hypothetical protein
MATHPAPPLALHVTLRWGDDAIVFRRLHVDGAAAVGAHPDAIAPIPCPPALAGGFVFARVAGGAATALVPDGSIASVQRACGAVVIVEGPAAVGLGAGDTAQLTFGEFRVTAAAGAPEVPPPRRRHAAGAWGALALATLAHAVVLGLAAHDARAQSADDREEERNGVLAGLLASAEQRERANDVPIADGSGWGEGRRADDRHGDGRLGGGEKARGEEGALGSRIARPGTTGRYAVPERIRKDPDPSMSRAETLADAEQFGMIGLLAQGPQAPSAPFADAWAHGADALAANGSLWARLPGQVAGDSGLGLTGYGESAGGRGEGIGLGALGTIGHGAGRPGTGTGGEGSRRLQKDHRQRPPWVGWGITSVSGRFPPEAIQRIVRQNFGRFRFCYERGLVTNPNLAGRVSVRFVIGRDGSVSNVADGGSDLPDRSVRACVVRAFSVLSFPQPDDGIVTVTYPIVFTPG